MISSCAKRATLPLTTSSPLVSGSSTQQLRLPLQQQHSRLYKPSQSSYLSRKRYMSTCLTFTTTRPSSEWSCSRSSSHRVSTTTSTTISSAAAAIRGNVAGPARSSDAAIPISSRAGVAGFGGISGRRAFSSSAAMCAPRNTFRESHLVRKRRNGYLSRVRTRNGRKILMRRKLKGRKNLATG